MNVELNFCFILSVIRFEVLTEVAMEHPVFWVITKSVSILRLGDRYGNSSSF
jgi:hypothetical protein